MSNNSSNTNVGFFQFIGYKPSSNRLGSKTLKERVFTISVGESRQSQTQYILSYADPLTPTDIKGQIYLNPTLQSGTYKNKIQINQIDGKDGGGPVGVRITNAIVVQPPTTNRDKQLKEKKSIDIYADDQKKNYQFISPPPFTFIHGSKLLLILRAYISIEIKEEGFFKKVLGEGNYLPGGELAKSWIETNNPELNTRLDKGLRTGGNSRKKHRRRHTKGRRKHTKKHRKKHTKKHRKHTKGRKHTKKHRRHTKGRKHTKGR